MVLTRTICRGSLVLFTLCVASTPAMSQAVADDATVLRRDVLPALDLARMPQVEAAFRSFTDCYSETVERSPQSALRRDDEVRKAERLAGERCKTLGSAAMVTADTQVTILSPGSPAAERAEVLRAVRRQLSLFALIRRYARAGRAKVFQRYLERVGRAGRAGRPVTMLIGE